MPCIWRRLCIRLHSHELKQVQIMCSTPGELRMQIKSYSPFLSCDAHGFRARRPIYPTHRVLIRQMISTRFATNLLVILGPQGRTRNLLSTHLLNKNAGLLLDDLISISPFPDALVSTWLGASPQPQPRPCKTYSTPQLSFFLV